MINWFISGGNRETVLPFLTEWPNSASERVRLIPYGKSHRIASIEPGLFLFSDIDRIKRKQLPIVATLQDRISDHFGGNCIFNGVSRVAQRFDLLMLLWREGINPFRPYSWEERHSVTKFPVFVRRSNDHSGPRSPLIYDLLGLRRECERLGKIWRFRNRLIVVEYCETRCDDGWYRKYSSFRIGNEIVPGHIIFLENWVAKDNPPEPMRDEERAYLEKNPHRDELMRIFNLAGIEYGRIDYSIRDGAIVVWEINTNPILLGGRKAYHPESHSMKQALADGLASALLAAAELAGETGKTSAPLMLGSSSRTGVGPIARADSFLRPISLKPGIGRDASFRPSSYVTF